MRVVMLAGWVLGCLVCTATPSLATAHQGWLFASNPDDGATPETIMQEIKDKHLCDVTYERRKSLLMHAFREGLTPANQTAKMAELEAGLNRLNQEKKASDAWREGRLKVYGEKLAKMKPEARRAVVKREIDKTAKTLQTSIDSMNEFLLESLNSVRRFVPQLGQPLSKQQWLALTPEQRQALIAQDKQRLKALGAGD